MLCFPRPVFGQHDGMTDIVRAFIDSTLKARLGSDCEIDGFVNMDAMLKMDSSNEKTHEDILNLNAYGFENP